MNYVGKEQNVLRHNPDSSTFYSENGNWVVVYRIILGFFSNQRKRVGKPAAVYEDMQFNTGKLNHLNFNDVFYRFRKV